MTTDLHGILVATVTPFTADGGAVDVDNLHAQAERLIGAGVHGLVPGGSTGEFTAMTLAERKQVTEESVKAAAGRVPVVVGTGALSTTETVELSRHAAEAGAQAVMVVAPFYDTPTIPELHTHLAAVHEASGLPIVYYNLPAITGLRLTPAELAGLGDVPGVRYLKDTSGDAVSLGELLVERPDRITAFNGWDTLTFFGLASGATGSVWGATNLIPELSVELWEALSVRGDLAAGRDVWARIRPLCRVLESYNYSAAVKTGLELIGHGAGPVRAPFELLGEQGREELRAALGHAGVL